MAVDVATPDARELEYGENSGRLQQVMSACDPNIIFHMKQHRFAGAVAEAVIVCSVPALPPC